MGIYVLTVLDKVQNPGVFRVGYYWGLWRSICSMPLSWLLIFNQKSLVVLGL